MARGDSLARHLQLFMLLDGVRELEEVDAAAHRVGYARRDFEVLQRVGMPLFQKQQGRRARWRLDDGYRRRLSVTLGLGDVFDPYLVHQDRGAIYLIGRAHERRAARTFLIDRLVSLRALGAFEVRPDFDAKDFLQGSFGLWSGRPLRLTLRFRGKSARLVSESIHHPTQVNHGGATDARRDVPRADRPGVRRVGPRFAVRCASSARESSRQRVQLMRDLRCHCAVRSAPTEVSPSRSEPQ